MGHSGLNLMPQWIGLLGVAMYLVIGASHLRHMRLTSGQRRPWHACHVLMAIGMAFMYMPAVIDPFTVPAGFWEATFATAGILAAFWAVGGVGRVAIMMWMGTAFDLAVMLYMWSGSVGAGDARVSWTLLLYLVAEAVAWVFDAYRRIDGSGPAISWQTLSGDPGGAAVRATVTGIAADSRSLLGGLDISVSMVGMTLGMAYMVVAMQLMS